MVQLADPKCDDHQCDDTDGCKRNEQMHGRGRISRLWAGLFEQNRRKSGDEP